MQVVAAGIRALRPFGRSWFVLCAVALLLTFGLGGGTPNSPICRLGPRLFRLGSGQVAFRQRLLDLALGLFDRRLGFRHALLGVGDGLLCTRLRPHR